MSAPERIKSLIHTFSEGVVRHREYMFTNHVVANRYFERYLRDLKELVSFGGDGFAALADLLYNPRPVVRITAAIYLISFCPERAIPVLQAEINEKSPFSAEAIVTLEKWKTGRYLDPFTGTEKKIDER